MKDKRILLTKDIQDIYTKVVNTYLEKGYTIHIGSMSGMCSNEVSRIDVTNGKDVYRIMLKTDSYTDFSSEIYFYTRKAILTVEKYENKANIVKMGDCHLWSDKSKVVCSKEWYGIGDKNKAWTDSIEYSYECYKKACERSKNKPYYDKENTINLTDTTRAKVVDIVRHTKGYMRIKDSDIYKVKIETARSGRKEYIVYFNNGKNALTIANTRR